MSRVVVVGDLVTDVVVRTAEPISRASDTPARISMLGGGAAANTACWLAESHVNTALVAKVGADEAGRTRSLELVGHGVDSRVVTDHDRPTGTIVVLVEADGQRTMLTDRGASARLAPRDIPVDLFGRGAHLHLSGYTLLHPDSRDAGRHALRQAADAGMSISVDGASAAPLRSVGAADFRSWATGVDLLLVNAEEADVLTNRADPAAAARALSADFPNVVVKVGAQGAIWATPDRLRSCPAAPARVVDTTGAGDAFAAGVLVDWLTPGGTPDSALARGAALAARAVARAGGRPATG